MKYLAEEFEEGGEDLVNSDKIKKGILAKLEQMRKDNKFNSLERIKDILITTDDWNEKDLITSTFKKKRNQIRDFYKEKIDEIYKNFV